MSLCVFNESFCRCITHKWTYFECQPLQISVILQNVNKWALKLIKTFWLSKTMLKSTAFEKGESIYIKLQCYLIKQSRIKIAMTPNLSPSQK